MNLQNLPQSWLRLDPALRDAVLKKLIERRQNQSSEAAFELRRADRTKQLVPASLEQTHFLRLYETFGDRVAWTIGAPPILLKQVDADTVRQALATVQGRHDVLKARFSRTGEGYSMTMEPDAPLPFTAGKVPLTSALLGAEDWVRKRYAAMLAMPFEPWSEPLWRAEFYSVAGRGVLLLSYCSAIVDGESVYMIERELRTLLEGGSVEDLPAIGADYADYAHTQRQLLNEGRLDEALGWWRERLAGGPPAAWLDGREALGASHLYEQSLGRRTAHALDAYAAAHRTTPHTVLLAEFMSLIREMDGTDDIWVASATASRDLPGCGAMIGTFARQMPVRCPWPLAGDALQRVHGAFLETMDQPPVPHVLIADMLEKTHPGAPSPFRYVFNHRHGDPAAGEAAGDDVPFQPSPDFSGGEREEDILLMILPSDDQRRLHWYLRADRFDTEAAKDLLLRFHAALRRRLQA